MSDLHDKALEAGKAWGGFAAPPRLIAQRENAVFEVMLRDGRRAALRLHRPGYQSGAAIWSEQEWTAKLAKRGFPCPQPIETEFGAQLVSFGSGHKASLVTWIDAPSLAQLTEQDCLAHMERLGALIRQLHDATDQIETDQFVRPSWDADALLGESPHWGRFWENPSLTRLEVQTLLGARDRAAALLDALEAPDIGLIHADLLRENILCHECDMHIIDFDDAGFGFRLYDLGTALIQYEHHPDVWTFADRLCRGYGCDPSSMPLFMALRAFASCGWAISRLGPTDPRQRHYADRALRCAALLRAR